MDSISLFGAIVSIWSGAECDSLLFDKVSTTTVGAGVSGVLETLFFGVSVALSLIGVVDSVGINVADLFVSPIMDSGVDCSATTLFDAIVVDSIGLNESVVTTFVFGLGLSKDEDISLFEIDTVASGAKVCFASDAGNGSVVSMEVFLGRGSFNSEVEDVVASLELRGDVEFDLGVIKSVLKSVSDDDEEVASLVSDVGNTSAFAFFDVEASAESILEESVVDVSIVDGCPIIDSLDFGFASNLSMCDVWFLVVASVSMLLASIAEFDFELVAVIAGTVVAETFGGLGVVVTFDVLTSGFVVGVDVANNSLVA